MFDTLVTCIAILYKTCIVTCYNMYKLKRAQKTILNRYV